MMNKYKTILADPPWQEKWHYSKSYKHKSAISLPYSTMSLQQIKALQVNDYASAGCHLWLWTTNQYLREGFEVRFIPIRKINQPPSGS